MTSGSIRIRGARQNNLRGVDVEIPRDRLTAVTGVSGSGKSSLAFDTLFREGQRRFLETLSAYARQFLGRMEKPDVEAVEGLSPAIAVDQRTTSRGARSTVGTLTEVVDHLRVLFARAGTAHCASCDLPLQSQTPEGIVQQVLREEAGRPVLVLAPRIRDRKGHHRPAIEEIAQKGFVRVRVDGEVLRTEEVPELARYKRHTIEIVVDRLKPSPEHLPRLREAIEQAVDLGGGDVVLATESGDRGYSTQRTCPGCGADAPPLEPRLFSFNSPHGACPRCDGLGRLQAPTESRLVPDPALSIREGALAVTRKSGGALLFPKVDFRFLDQVAEAHGFDLDTPWSELSRAARRVVLHGSGDQRFEDHASWNGQRYQGSVTWRRRFRGVIPALERAHRAARKQVRKYLSLTPCEECEGSRLRREARAVRLGGRRLHELSALSVTELRGVLGDMTLSKREARIARDLLVEIERRLGFLVDVGLDYLTLERSADTLSGGEAQRIRLAAQLGAGLQGVLYVLDEPSIGLHHRDHGRLLEALRKLRDAGNTVVVVEHDEATLRAADHLIDVGPGAGSHGGELAGVGTPADVAKLDTPTGRFLRGELSMPAPDERRPGNGDRLVVRGARAFNLKGVDVSIPLATLTAVTGVSGSGKSTLVNRILLRAALRHLERETEDPGECDGVDGLEHVGDVVCIDSKPIGRTPRSNPATYTGALTPIRDLFANLPEAKLRGYSKSRFSFNVAGGRCEACGGAGAQLVELQFLAPVTVVCEDCGGARFQQETLDVRYREHSIADVLEMTVEEAYELFRDHPKIARPLEHLVTIGVGYLRLGQPSTTLSGGEAQRVKLATHLQKRTRAHTLYVLDEPTTGLHQLDVQRLVGALQELVDRGQSVLVIEHNLDVVRAADHVIDLGPEGGAGGGRLIASGTPEEVMAVKASHTGQALGTPLAKARKRSRSAARSKAPAAAPTHIEVHGARTHNLKNVDVRIPRDALTVVTGPSGSGKSSLALDTIYTEGRRRFVESLSTYARQFLGTKDRPPVERIDGLGPSVAVEAGTVRGGPRSTVATTTEIHDHLRVLWARAGTPRCPEHGRPLERRDASGVARAIVRELDGSRGWIVAPIFGPLRPPVETMSKELARRAESWKTAGFLRMLVDGKEHRLDAKLPRIGMSARVDLVVDRLSFASSSRARIAEAVEQAEGISGGLVAAIAKGGERLELATRGACPECGFVWSTPIEPRHFSFNTHSGACRECDGLGRTLRCDPERLVSDPDRSLFDGAIGGKFGRYLTKGKGYYEHLLRTVGSSHRLKLDRPFSELPAAAQALLLHGKGARKTYDVRIERSTRNAELEESFTAEWPGLCGQVDAWYGRAEDPEWIGVLETVMRQSTCGACGGDRLTSEAAAVTIGRTRLPELQRQTVEEALAWARKLRLPKARRDAVAPVLAEVTARLELLERVGLGYLTLERSTSTLSGGEARRVRLSASLGSQLVGVCYVLDEPTVGLHPGDVARLTDALLELRDRGNTVLVVEHDEHLMERADCIVDMGPGAGRLGGQVVACGEPAHVRAQADSLTGAALRGELVPQRERATGAGDLAFRLRGARQNNLTGVDFEARFGRLTGVCGPSGSGKSTLVLDTLVPALQGESPQGRWRKLEGSRARSLRTVVVDATPIGRTPASVPATYSGLLDPLRDLYARTADARVRGFGPGHFSFNGTRGRCPACEGKGATRVEMQFLADLWLVCEECDGRRYRAEVLEVRHRGKSIADVLDMSVSEALEFLAHQPRCAAVLQSLQDVGLGYLPLGQSSTTLSGGEAQRVKLASELLEPHDAARSVIVLDEPTTGLHASDVSCLVAVLDALARRGHAVVVVEHHTGLLGVCDTLVELGPGGGGAGGRVIAVGTPAELATNPESRTGPWLPRPQTPRARKASRTPLGKRRTRPEEVAP